MDVNGIGCWVISVEVRVKGCVLSPATTPTMDRRALTSQNGSIAETRHA